MIDDLAKYYTALTVAIANFHTERMAVINKIIRELWKSTYKGNDIDYIEIFTDGGSDAVANADKRNVANYKVGVRFPGLSFRSSFFSSFSLRRDNFAIKVLCASGENWREKIKFFWFTLPFFPVT